MRYKCQNLVNKLQFDHKLVQHNQKRGIFEESSRSKKIYEELRTIKGEFV